jgi:hypothetical protein
MASVHVVSAVPTICQNAMGSLLPSHPLSCAPSKIATARKTFARAHAIS